VPQLQLELHSFTQATFECFGYKELIIKRYINSSVYFTLLSVCPVSSKVPHHYHYIYCDAAQPDITFGQFKRLLKMFVWLAASER